MKGDFTRDTFDARKHYSRVLMQQGRLLLDADYNEENSIVLHYLHCLARDLIGSQGGPSESCGFEIIPLQSDNSDLDFAITCGRYYVDGILCENDSPTSKIVKAKQSNKGSKSEKKIKYIWKTQSGKPLRESKTEYLDAITYSDQLTIPFQNRKN